MDQTGGRRSFISLALRSQVVIAVSIPLPPQSNSSLFAAKDVLHGQTPKRSSILQLPSAVLHFVIDRSLGRSRSVQ
jgi:hypothetical protein